MKLKMWRPVKPLTLDKLCLVSFKGVIISVKRKSSMNVIIQLLGFHILLPFAKQTTDGRTTASHLSASDYLGGGSKGFKDFGRFTKCTSKISSGRRLLSLFHSFNTSHNVAVILARPSDSTSTPLPTLIRADISKMSTGDLSSVDSILDLVHSMRF